MERHPFTPFLPADARLLMLGTFPPARKRWCMEFYYPNFTNDMWRIFGLCFFGDKMHFVLQEQKTYNLEAIISFLNQRGIALYDTCTSIVRTTGTASDKDLQVIEETNLHTLLRQLPQCQCIATAGQLATTLACRQFAVAEPKVGFYSECSCDNRPLRIYRMPSSSRAYPMGIEKKAVFYQKLFNAAFTPSV